MERERTGGMSNKKTEQQKSTGGMHREMEGWRDGEGGDRGWKSGETDRRRKGRTEKGTGAREVERWTRETTKDQEVDTRFRPGVGEMEGWKVGEMERGRIRVRIGAATA